MYFDPGEQFAVNLLGNKRPEIVYRLAFFVSISKSISFYKFPSGSLYWKKIKKTPLIWKSYVIIGF